MKTQSGKKAVCLLSGGLDSATALYVARSEGYQTYALTADYGQLHKKEIVYAKRIAQKLGIEHQLIAFSLPWKGSALLDKNIALPLERNESTIAHSIPSSYVPARNSIFLSLAASYAEAIEADAIYFGANALDYSGYPDCRPAFLEAFQAMIEQGTKAGIEGKALRVIAPLIHLNKKEIVLLGRKLGVPFEETWSCYQGKHVPCGLCDSCILRAKGFREAGLEDPLIHHASSAH